jgi:hypothetical protein
MPKVGVNNEPLLERLIFGYDGADYRVVKVDTSGNLVAAILAGQSIEVTQDTAADLKATVNLATDQNIQARGYGWIGGAWQKNPLGFGYSARGSQQLVNTNAAAGYNNVSSSAVPAGEIWILSAASASDNSNTITQIDLSVTVNGNPVVIGFVLSPVAAQPCIALTQVALAEGDTIAAGFYGCVAGDDLYLRYCYTRIDIDQ